MDNSRRLAGICALVFGIATFAALIVGSPPGGEFKAADVAAFTAVDHAGASFASIYLILVAAVALLWLGGYLRADAMAGEGIGRFFNGLMIAAVAGLAGGWTIAVTPSAGRIGGVAPETDPAVAYTIMETGLAAFIVAGGALLGIALLVLAITARRLPMWLRIAAGIAAVAGIAAPLVFFAYFLVLIFAVLLGIWLLATRSRSA